MKLRVLLFYAAGALAFSVFFALGVAETPFIASSAGPATPNTAVDSARFELTLAERALEAATGAEDAEKRSTSAGEALAHARRSLTLRPTNPHAWHARALANELLAREAEAVADYRMSVLHAPFEQTLAITRIDFALRNWQALSEDDREYVRDQIRWIWPRKRGPLLELVNRSAVHAGVILSAVDDTGS